MRSKLSRITQKAADIKFHSVLRPGAIETFSHSQYQCLYWVNKNFCVTNRVYIGRRQLKLNFHIFFRLSRCNCTFADSKPTFWRFCLRKPSKQSRWVSTSENTRLPADIHLLTKPPLVVITKKSARWSAHLYEDSELFLCQWVSSGGQTLVLRNCRIYGSDFTKEVGGRFQQITVYWLKNDRFSWILPKWSALIHEVPPARLERCLEFIPNKQPRLWNSTLWLEFHPQIPANHR